MKFLLSVILICLVQIQLSDSVQRMGKTLCMIQNLPHRGLGMMYTAMMLQPHRVDWQKSYIVEWAIATSEDRLREGTTKPVIPFIAIQLQKQFPDDKEMKFISGLCKDLHRRQHEQ